MLHSRARCTVQKPPGWGHWAELEGESPGQLNNTQHTTDRSTHLHCRQHVYVCVCACACVYVCVCACMWACVHVYLWIPFPLATDHAQQCEQHDLPICLHTDGRTDGRTITTAVSAWAPHSDNTLTIVRDPLVILKNMSLVDQSLTLSWYFLRDTQQSK